MVKNYVKIEYMYIKIENLYDNILFYKYIIFMRLKFLPDVKST